MKKTIIGIVLLLVVGFGIYYFSSNSPQTSPSIPAPALGVQTTPLTTSVPTVKPTCPYQTQLFCPNGYTYDSRGCTTGCASGKVAPANVSISIKNFTFIPSTLTIKKGTTVTWTNNDSTSHTVTADAGNLFDSGPILPGRSFNFVFDNPGSISYHCNIHKSMQAVIVVQK